MERLLLAVLLAAIAAAVAFALRRRRSDPPSTPPATVPTQIDRGDFAEPGIPWLVVVFTSATCLSCLSVWHRVRTLERPGVVVEQVEAKAAAGLHRRYSIDSVPLTLAVDDHGVVRASVLGPLGDQDLATLSEIVG